MNQAQIKNREAAEISSPIRHFHAKLHVGVEPTLLADNSVSSAKARALYLADEQDGKLTEFYEVFPPEEVTEPEAPDFKSQADIWRYLFDGGMVNDINADVRLKIVDGVLLNSVSGGEWLANITATEKFEKIITEPVKNWTDALNDQGIMCWVSDNDTRPCSSFSLARLIACACAHESFFIDDLGYEWKYAAPLTQAEMITFTYGATI